MLASIDGATGDLARMVDGTGMRLMEALRLRVKDVDFERCSIVMREGKGRKDRIVMLPERLREPLRGQLERARLLWAQDRAAQRAGVCLPNALERKYPRAGASWTWFWVWPSPTLPVKYGVA